MMNMKWITSAQNRAYKQALHYQSSREARKAGVFLVEGVRAVDELAKAPDWQLESLWLSEERVKSDPAYTEALLHAFPENLPVYGLPAALFARLADTQSPQGVLAVVKRRSFDLAALLAKSCGEEAPFFVLLENLQDPGNLGTILRTADSAGAGGIIYTKGTVDVYSPKVVRSAMGSLLHVPTCAAESVAQIAPALHAKGVRLLAAHLRGEQYHFNQNMTGPIAIMIGNEGAGLSAEAAAMADALVKIPMVGRAESLNAAMAAGILMYEVVRQRMTK